MVVCALLILGIFVAHTAGSSNGVTIEKRSTCNKNTGLFYYNCLRYHITKHTRHTKCGFWNWARCTKITYRVSPVYYRCSRTCKVDGNWSKWQSWGEWGSCNRDCDYGTQARYRTRLCDSPTPKNGGKHCAGEAFQKEVRSCLIRQCEVHGQWSNYGPWSKFGTCSVTCGSGVEKRYRYRTCTNPAPQHGGKGCSGSRVESEKKKCNTTTCPVNGGWSEYGEWDNYTECSASCGNGTQVRYRYRTCTDPLPQHGGQDCKGHRKQESNRTCNEFPCPVHGAWSTWGNWSEYETCSMTCDEGVQMRYRERLCNNPRPQHHGKKCAGRNKAMEARVCFDQYCKNDTIVGPKESNKTNDLADENKDIQTIINETLSELEDITTVASTVVLNESQSTSPNKDDTVTENSNNRGNKADVNESNGTVENVPLDKNTTLNSSGGKNTLDKIEDMTTEGSPTVVETTERAPVVSENPIKQTEPSKDGDQTNTNHTTKEKTSTPKTVTAITKQTDRTYEEEKSAITTEIPVVTVDVNTDEIPDHENKTETKEQNSIKT